MKFRIFASLLVLAVAAALGIFFGDEVTSTFSGSSGGMTDFSNDAVNSLRQ